MSANYWDGLKFSPPWWEEFQQSTSWKWGAALLVGAGVILIHQLVRKIVAGMVARQLEIDQASKGEAPRLAGAFRRRTQWWQTLLKSSPKGWDRRSKRVVEETIQDRDRYVQELNDHFTNPSGT